ncbi:MAG: hypothetical protein QXS18_06130, partial [Thermoplasmata archaeon]
MRKQEWYIDLCDKYGNILQRIEKAEGISFNYLRQGGCGQLDFTIKRDFVDLNLLDFENRVHLYLKRVKIFTGYIAQIKSDLENLEKCKITCYGFYQKLSRVEINKSYSINNYPDIRNIVIDIIIQVINNGIEINLNNDLIKPAGWTPDVINFERKNALECIKMLAILAGAGSNSLNGESLAFDWGVDENLNFYFKDRNLNEIQHFVIGDKIVLLNYETNTDEIKNYIHIYGGVIKGEGENSKTLHAVVYDSNSINKYGKREYSENVDCIISDIVAQRYAAGILEEFSKPAERGNLQIENFDKIIKPEGIFRILNTGGKIKEIRFYPHEANYNITENLLSANFSLGKPRANISTTFKKLLWMIENNQIITDTSNETVNNDIIVNKNNLVPNGSFEIFSGKSIATPIYWNTNPMYHFRVKSSDEGLSIPSGAGEYCLKMLYTTPYIYREIKGERYFQHILKNPNNRYIFRCYLSNKKGNSPYIRPVSVILYDVQTLQTIYSFTLSQDIFPYFTLREQQIRNSDI